jgi:hypothetical protein
MKGSSLFRKKTVQDIFGEKKMSRQTENALEDTFTARDLLHLGSLLS